MTVKITCNRCKVTKALRGEYEGEIWWSNHKCKGKPDLNSLPLHLLKEVAQGTMTEEAAFKRAAGR